MLESYTSIGMPIMYDHWSFGQQYINEEYSYRKGMRGLAYEIVINSDPCIAYLMEENSMAMQLLVIAHACVSGDTEYLSPDGWKSIDGYRGGLVAQYNEDGTAEFVQPTDYIKREQTDFIHIENKKIDQAITDDHTVVFDNGNGNLVKITGKELADKHEKKTRGFTGKFITGFYLNNASSLDMSDDLIKLHVAIKADGSIVNPGVDKNHPNAKPHYRIRFHLKKKRKIERLISLLVSLGIAYSISDTYDERKSIHFNYPELVDKRYGKEWFAVSLAQRHIIADEVLLWDGSEERNSFYSKFHDDITFVQYVWASIGYSPYIYEMTRCLKVSYKENGRDSLSDRKSPGRKLKRISSKDG